MTPTKVTRGRSKPFPDICLPAAADGMLQRLSGLTRERAAVPTAQLKPEIDDRRRRQGHLAHALRQREQREVAVARGLVRDDPRRRASQQDRRARSPTERERRVHGVVARGALLLVRRLLLLVDHDEADALE